MTDGGKHVAGPVEPSGPTTTKKKSKKAKRKQARREAVPVEPLPPLDDGPEAPLARGPLGLSLLVVMLTTVFLVAIWFKLDVNRVFDVPKALALKVGGAGGFLVWLLYALFGPGFGWRSFRLFAGPVFGLAAVVVVSTFLSLDTVTSIFGVYERQFGMHGFLACVGLYAITSTVLTDKRGAIFGLAWLAIIGGLVGTYALLQSQGLDPFPFFHDKPHNKVYSFLGNATFAGNALALIFPISTVLAIVAGVHTLSAKQWAEGGRGLGVGAWLVGIVGVLCLQIVPAAMVASNPDGASRESVYKLTATLSFLLALGSAGLGTWGPKGLRLATPEGRRAADALGAGALAAAAIGIVMGLLFTRTRGAWVGSAVAITLGFLLLPMLFRQTSSYLTVRIACWGSLALGVAFFSVYLTMAEEICTDPKGRCLLYARTIHSIPAAFDPDRVGYGKGQGTRKYLWTESPRVLVDHADTLERIYDDRGRYDAHVKTGALPGVVKRDWGPFREDEVGFDRTWRTLAVWPLGIGIEAYRFAFMSHKSKRLEALDPMTNHDNPHNNYLYVLASFGVFGLLAYLWLLWRLLSQAFRRFYAPESVGEVDAAIADRALAFGVVTSFFSYAVYSIAGFDSVACSVFLFFLLGCAAVLFEPNLTERPRGLLVGLRAHWAELRGQDHDPNAPAPVWAAVALTVLGFGLLGHAVLGGVNVYRAERAFVGDGARSYQAKVDNILRAIAINPNESFYRQNLGSTYLDMARGFRRRAQQASQKGDQSAARAAADKMQKLAKKGEIALYSALAHAWAPENIYISLFQVYYHLNEVEKSKDALRWALEHSPHLGAVRANLAALELQTKDYEGALANTQWVMEVEPKNATALRTRVQTYMALDDLEKAKKALDEGLRRRPRDKALTQIRRQLDARIAAATSTTP